MRIIAGSSLFRFCTHLSDLSQIWSLFALFWMDSGFASLFESFSIFIVIFLSFLVSFVLFRSFLLFVHSHSGRRSPLSKNKKKKHGKRAPLSVAPDSILINAPLRRAIFPAAERSETSLYLFVFCLFFLPLNRYCKIFGPMLFDSTPEPIHSNAPK